MSDTLFEYIEVNPNVCQRPNCGRLLVDGKCPWHDAVRPTPVKNMARRSDPSTSKRAAEKARYRTGTHKALILEAHGRNPEGLTDEESAPASGLTYHQAERRCCDLRNEGMLTILTDETGAEVERQGTSGSWMRVSVLTDLGIATLRTMKEHDARPSNSPVHVPAAAGSTGALHQRDYYADRQRLDGERS